ncbi:glutathione S-transferase family protein [Almyronema epifaneia]|uniref:Glutathione S-transferase family protein n=1 Tax=Almyronema epifaneia S1 TaxID=2991925 RepID=A0ABW6ICF5_9CYAN
MLTLYHTPLSINSRRVWVTLLEKGLQFDLVEVDLGGDQFKPAFLALNPFHHIPVLVDEDFKVIESFAILDYLEAMYPSPPLMPCAPQAIARVRMVQMVTLNELLPALTPLTRKMMGFGEPDAEAIAKAKQQADGVLRFLAQILDNHVFFGVDHLSLGDIVLGTVVPWFAQLEIPLENYPNLQAWCDRLVQRPAWQTTQPTAEALAAFRERMRQLMDRRDQS